jgi:uncharacterized protein
MATTVKSAASRFPFPRTSLKRWAMRSIAVAGTTYGGLCAALYLVQPQIIFNARAGLTQTPQAFNLPYEEVRIPSTDQASLHGWWIPAAVTPIPSAKVPAKDAPKPAAKPDLQSGPKFTTKVTPPPKGVVLYLHGKGSPIDANIGQARRFQKLGYSVLLFDYRGFGNSTGPYPTESGVYADAQAAWDYLVQQRGYAPSQIVIFGHSLGGAIALDLASRQPDAAGVIAQSTFTSMRAMVDANPQYRFFPIDLLLHQRFNSLEKVKTLQLPVLYIHGNSDDVVPAAMSPQLYAASPEPKQIQRYNGAGHNTVADVGKQDYLDLLDQFMRRSLRPPISQ